MKNPDASRRRIGVMGGTFDPIHYGHLVTAESAYESFCLDRVIFVPAGNPPHKIQDAMSSAAHRLSMTSLALKDNPHFSVSSYEVDREDISYTIETLRYFHRLYGPEVDLFFITGVDAIIQIPFWNNAEGLFEVCHFIAATRPGYPITNIHRFRDQLQSNHRDRIHILEVPALAISSTDLRQRVRMGRSIKYLVPEPVENYIAKRGLYGGSPSAQAE